MNVSSLERVCILRTSTVSELTIFDLVNQDEGLLTQPLKKLSVKRTRFKVAEYRTERHGMLNVQAASAKLSGLHTLGVRRRSRDVIEVNKAGYVLTWPHLRHGYMVFAPQ